MSASPVISYERLLARASKVHDSKSEVIIIALAYYLGCTEDVPLSEIVADLEAKV